MSDPEYLFRCKQTRQALSDAIEQLDGEPVAAFAYVAVTKSGEMLWGADYRADGSAKAMAPKLRHMLHYMKMED